MYYQHSRKENSMNQSRGLSGVIAIVFFLQYVIPASGIALAAAPPAAPAETGKRPAIPANASPQAVNNQSAPIGGGQGLSNSTNLAITTDFVNPKLGSGISNVGGGEKNSSNQETSSLPGVLFSDKNQLGGSVVSGKDKVIDTESPGDKTRRLELEAKKAAETEKKDKEKKDKEKRDKEKAEKEKKDKEKRDKEKADQRKADKEKADTRTPEQKAADKAAERAAADAENARNNPATPTGTAQPSGK